MDCERVYLKMIQIDTTHTSWTDLFSQNAKLRKPANVVNPYYAQTTWVISKGQTLLFLYTSKKTFRQGVCDGGSHVETSSICVVPLALYRLVVIHYVGESGAALVTYYKNTFHQQGVSNDGAAMLKHH